MLICGVLFVGMTFTGCSSQKGVDVVYDGKTFEDYPFKVVDGTIYVPAEETANNLGYEWTINGDKYRLSKNDYKCEDDLSDLIDVDGTQYIELDTFDLLFEDFTKQGNTITVVSNKGTDVMKRLEEFKETGKVTKVLE